jgi:anti-sigma B factor antagonist
MPTILNYPRVTVIRPQGYFNASNAWQFEREMTAALAQQENTTLVVDLSSVESLDSAGVMALVSALKVADSLGKKLRLASVSPSIKIIFELTQLDQVFEIWELEADVA